MVETVDPCQTLRNGHEVREPDQNEDQETRSVVSGVEWCHLRQRDKKVFRITENLIDEIKPLLLRTKETKFFRIHNI